jgi:uncharacterized protein
VTPAGRSPAGRGHPARVPGHEARRDGQPGRRDRRRGAFVLNVRALRSRPGNRQEVHLSGSIPALAVTHSWVPEDAEVRFDGEVESTLGGVTLAGTVTAPWTGSCRRCVEPASGVLRAEVRELCIDSGESAGPRRQQGGSPVRAQREKAAPDEDEAGEYYAVGPDELDVEPIVHDACILELPLAPLCSESCRGLCPGCGVNLNGGDCSCTGQVDLSASTAAGGEHDSEHRQESE